MTRRARLRVYRFDAGFRYDGSVVGALERADAGDGPRVLDALFVARDERTGELEAVDLGAGRADGTLAALLDFRLDPGRRRATTERTLAGRPGSVPTAVLESIGSELAPGTAVLALLTSGGEPAAFDSAVSGLGGSAVADAPVDAGAIAGLVADLRSAL
jgi:hypothetical protein